MSGLLIRQEKVGDEGRAFTSTHPPDLLLIPSSMLSQNTNGSHLSLCNVAYIIVLLATDLCDSKHLPSPSRPSTQTPKQIPQVGTSYSPDYRLTHYPKQCELEVGNVLKIYLRNLLTRSTAKEVTCSPMVY